MSNDEEIAALVSGEAQAAEVFVREHAGWMLAVARRITMDHELAEDCVQEAFVNAFRSLDTFEHRSNLKTWLYRIVTNQALTKLRSRKRQNEESFDALMPAFDEYACRVEEPWAHLATPDDIFEQDSRAALVRDKIQLLPERYRIVLQLRDIEEQSTAEVAEVLGLSEANVRVLLHRARSALKKLIEPLLKGEL